MLSVSQLIREDIEIVSVEHLISVCYAAASERQKMNEDITKAFRSRSLPVWP
jgi:hypothetical protein